MPLRWTRALLDLQNECEITPYRSSGPGGQKKNKTESSVRATHRKTGLTRIATESRSQSANRLLALERIRLALEARNRRKAPRVPTKPTRASQERRMQEKALTAARKRIRRGAKISSTESE